MKIINKVLVIILINIAIVLINIVNYRTYGYYWQKPGTIMTTYGSGWRNQFFCINHNKAMDDNGRHTFVLTHRENYYSDDTDVFKMKMGYLFRWAQYNGDFQKVTKETNMTYYSGLGYGSGGNYGYPYYYKSKYQIALWKILSDYSKNGVCTNGRVPFRNSSTGMVEQDLWNSRKDAQEVYNTINNKISQKAIPKPCFAHVGLNSTELTTYSNDENKRIFCRYFYDRNCNRIKDKI